MNENIFKSMPELPEEKDWGFIEELKAPFHQESWGESREPNSNEADLRGGVKLNLRFPDTEGLLETAYADFRLFLKMGSIEENGDFEISVEQSETSCFEEYQIETSSDSCRIAAADTEGIRRALVWIEDEMLRGNGPFLPLGNTVRRPWIKTRISRCFFGPIKRPPMNRDELADDVDYYPGEYLNKLAHEGINALWLTGAFRDLCASKYFPESDGKDRFRRLEKLRATVAKCARYGIKIYLFCIEPIGFGEGISLRPFDDAESSPEFIGHKRYGNNCFCTSSPEALDYIETCTESIFSEVPGLGGLMDINLGERPTHCYSDLDSRSDNTCPRCSKREPKEVFAEMISAFVNGMKRGNPDAEMISWLYAPIFWDITGISIETQEKRVREFAASIPEGAVLLYNFESNGYAEQLGKERIVEDYSLAWPGPSDIFRDCAGSAIESGARVGAKIQAGCSHEVATAPFVPVPGNLYRKYREMRELGVDTVLQCWYFGNYPGIMNKTAGELSFDPFVEDEDAFLTRLAKRDWGNHAEVALGAWKDMQEGYLNFPANLGFAWYGPAHNCLVWPMHLFPLDEPISPSWHFEFPLVSGDRIGECIGFEHSLDEIVTLLDKVASSWGRGVEALKGIEAFFTDKQERKRDIILAEALGLQFTSARNLFTFYSLREQLPKSTDKLANLAEMRDLVLDEIENSTRMAELCELDPRLGFHSEAENYKYFPRWLTQRAEELRELLKSEFPRLEAAILAEEDIFPEYTGAKLTGNPYFCSENIDDAKQEKLNGCANCEWSVYKNQNVLHFSIKCSETANLAEIVLETRRLWPVIKFQVSQSGEMKGINQRRRMETRWEAETCESPDGGWQANIKIPLNILDDYAYQGAKLRFNVTLQSGENPIAWRTELHPFEYRLKFETDNPKDLDWIFFS